MGAREQILIAADELFGEVGFDAATTREIAEKSGVNKALIHYHFKNKELLLTSLLDDYYRRLAATLSASLESTGDFRDRISRLIDAYIDFLADHRNFARIVQREASGGAQVERIRQAMGPIFKLGVDLLRNEYPQTAGGELSAENILTSFYGMIISFFSFSDLLSDLWGADPLTPTIINERKKHIVRMAMLTIDEIERNPK